MDVRDLYSTRVQKTFDEDQAEIVSILSSHTGETVKLINYFKGIPLSYPAKIVSVTRGVVDLDLPEVQAYAVEQARSAFIRSPLFKHDLFAKAQYVNVKKKAATLSAFSYVEIMAERRNFVRVQVEPPSLVALEASQGMIEGTLFDISLSGFSVEIEQFYPLEPKAEALVHFSLREPDSGKFLTIKLPTTLMSVDGDKSPYHYRFSFDPDKLLEQRISHYIFQRQIEIIRQVKELVC